MADNPAPMDHTFLSAFVLLLLVLDPFGSLPVFISVMGGVAPGRRRAVAMRESLIAIAGSREPFIFPLAVPLMAGPSAMATVLLLASRQPERMLSWVGALTAAMLISGAVLLSAERIRRLLGDSV